MTYVSNPIADQRAKEEREARAKAKATVCLPCATYLQTGWLPAPDDVLDRVEDWRATLTGYYTIEWSDMRPATDDGFNTTCEACNTPHPVHVTITNAYPLDITGPRLRMGCDLHDEFVIEFDRVAANTAIPSALGWVQHKGYLDYVARLMDLRKGKRSKAMGALVTAGVATMIEPGEWY